MLIMETPTKESVMVKLTPTSKKFKCILCGEMKENRKERQRLFHGEEKTDLWYIIERLLGINISEDDHSEICCRNCAKKLYTTDKSLRMTKETYDKSRNELIQSHGVKKFKRLSMDSSHNTKRKALFSTEGSSEVETASTNTEDDDAYGQCLGASARTEFSDLIEALQDGDLDRSLEYLQKNETLCNGMSDMLFENLKLEIQGLCSKEGNSVLRDSDKTSLLDFSFSKIADEWKERAPTFYKFLKYSSTNIRSEKRNKVKKSENLLYGQISAGSKLLHLYNMNMKAMQVINDIVLLKGGIKKSGFARLQAMSDCHSYRTALEMTDSLANKWDEELLTWQNSSYTDSETEIQIMHQLQYLKDTIDLCGAGGADTTDLQFELISLETELQNHRQNMHPGYYFVGDNIDIVTKVRQMTVTNKNKDQHMYQLCAYLNRISGNEFDNSKQLQDPATVLFSQLVPSQTEKDKMFDNFAFLVAKKWCQYIPFFGPFTSTIPEFIDHPHMTETKQRSVRVNMGVLKKNETKNEDMADICKFMHKYVPGHDERSTNMPGKVLSGGDYLTFERHKQAQMSVRDDGTPSLRLEGLVPKMEEFHNQAELLKVMWQSLYSTVSSRDIGTLFAARNITNARNVSADPSGNYYASELMANKFTDACIIAGAIAHFQMDNVASEPKDNIYTGALGDSAAMKSYLLREAKSFLQKYVCIDIKPLPNYGPQSNTFKCRYCGKSYKQSAGLRKHENKAHGHPDPKYDQTVQTNQLSSQESHHDEDMILNYTKLSLTLAMLRCNHNDALRMSDGDRIMLVNQYLFLLYKQANCPKYAYGLLETQCQTKILLTARMAHRLKWNRTVNHRGRADSNHPNDLDLEHCNKVFKNEVHSFRGIFTDKTISRVSRSALCTDQILRQIDAQTETRRPSGRHTDADLTEDINIIVNQLVQNEVFKNIPGRRHEAFPVVEANPFSSLDMEHIRNWISNSLSKFSGKHYY